MLSEVPNYLNAKLNLVPALWLLLTHIIHFYEKSFAPITAKLIQIQSHWLGSNYACAVVSCINFFYKDSGISTKLRLDASVTHLWRVDWCMCMCGCRIFVSVQNSFLTRLPRLGKVEKFNIEIQFLKPMFHFSGQRFTHGCFLWQPRTTRTNLLNISQSPWSFMIYWTLLP